MTKVCHLSSAHAPNDTRIFHKQCASLAKAGYQVSFVVKAKDAQSVGCTTQKGVQVIQVPVDSSSRFKGCCLEPRRFIRRLWRWMRTSTNSTTPSCCLTG